MHKDKKNVIKKALKEIGYYELDFLGSNGETAHYSGMLDTYYIIRVEFKSEVEFEVWDCIADEENYVKSALVNKKNNQWIISY